MAAHRAMAGSTLCTAVCLLVVTFMAGAVGAAPPPRRPARLRPPPPLRRPPRPRPSPRPKSPPPSPRPPRPPPPRPPPRRPPPPSPKPPRPPPPRPPPPEDGSNGLPEVVLLAHYEYRRTLAIQRCLVFGVGYNCSDPKNSFYSYLEFQHLFMEDYLMRLDERSPGSPPCGYGYYGASGGWTSANLTTALAGMRETVAQVLLAECHMTASCRTWRSQQQNPIAAIKTALSAGQQRFVSAVAELDSVARLCPWSDSNGVMITAAQYPDMFQYFPNTYMPNWAAAFVQHGELSTADMKEVFLARTMRRFVGEGMPELEELTQLLIHFSLSDALTFRLRRQAREVGFVSQSPSGESARRRKVLEAQPAELRDAEQWGSAPWEDADVGRRLHAISSSENCPGAARTVQQAGIIPAVCSLFAGPAGDIIATIEKTTIITSGTQKARTFLAAQVAMYARLIAAHSFSFTSADVPFVLDRPDFPEAVEAMVRWRSPRTARKLHASSLPGLVCALPPVHAQLFRLRDQACAGRCQLRACQGSNKELFSWEATLPLNKGLDAGTLEPAPEATGPVPTSSTGLPEVVLLAHYEYRRLLAMQRCLSNAIYSLYNCDDPSNLEIFTEQHLQWEQQLVGGGQRCNSGPRFGWTSSNLTIPLANISVWLPQVLYLHCNLTQECISWRDSQADPMALIQAAVNRGVTRMLDWAPSDSRTTRFCPLADPGGIFATASLPTPQPNGLYFAMHNWHLSHYVTRNDLTAGDVRQMLRLSTFSDYLSNVGLQEVEALQTLLVHFSLSDGLLIKYRNNPMRRSLLQQENVPNNRNFTPHWDVGHAGIYASRRGLLQAPPSTRMREIAQELSDTTQAACGFFTLGLGKYAALRDMALKGVRGLQGAGRLGNYVAEQADGLLSIAQASGAVQLSDGASLALSSIGFGLAVAGIMGAAATVGTTVGGVAALYLTVVGLACATADLAASLMNYGAMACEAHPTASICRAGANTCIGDFEMFLAP